MPIVHIEQLSGDDAGHWIAYAKSELRRWSEFNEQNATWSRTLTPTDGVTIRLRQCGQFQYIAINAEPGTYIEFETSGVPVVTQSIISGGFEIDNAYKPAVVSVSFDGITAKSTILTGKRQTNASLASRLKKPYQVNLANEQGMPVTSGSRRTDDPSVKHFSTLLYESCAPWHPYSGVYLRACNDAGVGAAHYARGSIDGQLSRDVGFDIPWGDTTAVKPIRLAVLNQPSIDWPRASGRMTVTDATFGTRVFAIYVDAFDQFFAFPLSQITALSSADATLQNVDPAFVKQAMITWPAWMYRKSELMRDYIVAHASESPFYLTPGLTHFPEYDWKVHPDGTKACAVVFERVAADYDTTYFGASGSHPTAFPTTQAAFDTFMGRTGIGNRHGETDGAGGSTYPEDTDLTNNPQRYCIGTGLVEVALSITLTGNNPQDFTFSATVNEVRAPSTTNLCTFIAGYTHYDIAQDSSIAFADRVYTTDRGDLCVLDIERYYKQADGSVASFFSVKNLTKATEVSTWWGGNTDGKLSLCQLLAYDMASLSFVFNMQLVETRAVTLTGSATYTALHPSAAIVTFNKLRTILYPDTMQDDKKTAIAAAVAQPGRSALDSGGWTYLGMNDYADWSYSFLTGVRDHYAAGIGTISAAQTYWYENAMTAYGRLPVSLLYITQPKFGWYVYADEIMNRLSVTPRSTFFVHPNGSWAFWDQHRIYNPYGLPLAGYAGNAVPDFIANATLEHVIYDAVHLENSKGALDTSFVALYNDAVTRGTGAGSLTDTFTTTTKDALKAVITPQTIVDSGKDMLELKATFGGGEWFYPEPALFGTSVLISTVGGGAIDLTFGDVFNTGSNFTGTISYPTAPGTPVTFSSMVMIT